MLGGIMGSSLKAARTGDQIDAEVKGALVIVQNTKTTAQQFDLIESQLEQFSQIISQADPMSAMQFTNLKSQINNIQTQINNGLTNLENSLRAIDGHTDKIQ